MPAWTVGELPAPPVWTRQNWAAMIGPGLTLAGAIGNIGNNRLSRIKKNLARWISEE